MKLLRDLSLAGMLTLVSSGAATDEERLQQCRAINKNIQQLESLRKEGGPARKMDHWKRRIHRHQDEYSRLGCRAHRHKL